MNQLHLQAQIQQLGQIRYTPAGLMALDASLKADSEVIEAGKPRKVSLEIKAVAMGEVARQLQALGVGGSGLFRGFLTHQRNGRGFIAHVTVIEPLAA
ncbi:primosomal replication protein N [Roseateles sp. BYS87W]|uniref:Primosomal replication protein N n=1 Tax=Pelomonas baiyunensis TaxID=3299026 RepID=A0ABW7GVE7_9BURK